MKNSRDSCLVSIFHGSLLPCSFVLLQVLPCPFVVFQGRGRESFYLVENINHFGDRGGFALILDRLNQTEDLLPPVCLTWLCKAIAQVRIPRSLVCLLVKRGTECVPCQPSLPKAMWPMRLKWTWCVYSSTSVPTKNHVLSGVSFMSLVFVPECLVFRQTEGVCVRPREETGNSVEILRRLGPLANDKDTEKAFTS